MICFARDETWAVAKVTLDVPNYDARVFSMNFECNSAVYAGLLADAMQRVLRSKMKAAREEAYAAGWRDAKAKRTRNDCFSGAM